jgi:DNA/RNA-binding domain of Phe-tRNA-synthetase-like protein
MTNESHVKLLMATTRMVEALAETNQQAGAMITQQHEMTMGLIESNQKVDQALHMILELVEQQRSAINELRKRFDQEELPAFDRSLFSPN